MIEQIVFCSMAGVTLLSALAVVTMRNAVHSALFLGLSLAGVAGLFALLGADFLFAAQILIYVGAIAILVLFVVMLMGRASDLNLRQINNQWLAGLLICGVCLYGFMRIVRLFSKTTSPAAPQPTTAHIGRLMMGDFAVPFELISLVIIAALLGAVYFSKTQRGQR
jgi:NADH-quinone oxidoreductase subunit J